MTSRAERAKSQVCLATDQRRFRSVIAERRIKRRLWQPFPTILEGADLNSQAFHHSTELEDLSSTGLYLRMPPRLNVGADLKVLISLSNGYKPGVTAFMAGRVVRVEPGLDGLNGFALVILQYEFVSNPDEICCSNDQHVDRATRLPSAEFT